MLLNALNRFNSAITDCAERYLFEFGYITFPLMSFTIFAFLIILMLSDPNRNVILWDSSGRCVIFSDFCVLFRF